MRECPTCRLCFPDHILVCPEDGNPTAETDFSGILESDRYRLEQRLAQGETGVVFKARDLILDADCAIKFMFAKHTGVSVGLQLFRRKVKAMSWVSHENLASIFDFGVGQRDIPYLVMEFVEGRSLQEINSSQGFGLRAAPQAAIATARALEALHERGFTHGNLKPSKIIIQSGGDLKLLGAGLWEFASDQLGAPSEKFPTSDSLPSALFRAPELWLGGKPDARSDIYSLGIILFLMLTGELPFNGSSAEAVREQHLRAAPLGALAYFHIEERPQLEAAVRHALEKNAEARTPSARALIEELSFAEEAIFWLPEQSRDKSLYKGAIDAHFGEESEIDLAGYLSEDEILDNSFDGEVEIQRAADLMLTDEEILDDSLGGESEIDLAEYLSDEMTLDNSYGGEVEIKSAEELIDEDLLEYSSGGESEPKLITLEEIEQARARELYEKLVLRRTESESKTEETDWSRRNTASYKEETNRHPIGAAEEEPPIFLSGYNSVGNQIGRFELPSRPKQLDENVQFTVYRPRAVEPERWYSLFFYAHLSELAPDAPAGAPQPKEEVERRARESLGKIFHGYSDNVADSTQAIPREGILTVVAVFDGIEFVPDHHTLLWEGPVHELEFKLKATRELEGQTVRGYLRVYLGILLVAEVPLALRVDTEQARKYGEAPAAVENPVARYRKIFASYSHKDEPVVAQFEELVEAFGDKYLRDVRDIRAGEKWDERLEELIREADIFQLFWSNNSMRSEFVQDEWQYALSLQKPNFIRPTFWECPMPEDKVRGLPPAALRSLQFKRVPIYSDRAFRKKTSPRPDVRRTFNVPMEDRYVTTEIKSLLAPPPFPIWPRLLLFLLLLLSGIGLLIWYVVK